MKFYGGVNDVSEKGQRYELGTSPIRLPLREPSFACPVCKRTIFIGNSSTSGRRSRKNSTASRPQSLEIPQAVEVISDYQRIDPQGVDVQYCEMCEVGASILASIKCEQCKVRYCEECLQRYHPPRGPLASHFLLKIRHRHTSGRLRSRKMSGSHPSTPTVHELPAGHAFEEYQTDDSKEQGIRLATCAFHVVETMTLYCDECSVSLCNRCTEEGRHKGHNVKPIGSVYEAYKVGDGILFFKGAGQLGDESKHQGLSRKPATDDMRTLVYREGELSADIPAALTLIRNMFHHYRAT